MICIHQIPEDQCIHCLRERIQILERGEAPALAAAVRALEVERRESARLRNAITKHRDNIWGQTEIRHEDDAELYAALRGEGE